MDLWQDAIKPSNFHLVKISLQNKSNFLIKIHNFEHLNPLNKNEKDEHYLSIFYIIKMFSILKANYYFAFLMNPSL